MSPTARYRRSLYLLLAPFLLGSMLLVIVPALLALSLAFTAYDGLVLPRWVGLDNFRTLWDDQIFRLAVGNSLQFVALTVPLRIVITLLLALLLNRRRAGVGLYRVAIYLPTVVPSVAYALIWLWIFNPLYGPLNLLLGSIGLPTPAWLVSRTTALPALAFMALFQIGEGFVVLLAGLQAVPREYHQAAMIDGAGPWQLFRQITLPLVMPWLLLLSIRDVIASAQNSFAPAYLMTGGGPYYATLFVPVYLYETVFDHLRFGEGAAMTVLLVLGVAAIVGLLYAIVGGWGYDDEV